MKLLFDQNLSFKLCSEVASLFPGSAQVGRIGFGTASDHQVWDMARADGFTLVSQDADFADIAYHRGPPPKVIWLRCGNQPTSNVAAILRRHAAIIMAFHGDPSAVCLELY